MLMKSAWRKIHSDVVVLEGLDQEYSACEKVTGFLFLACIIVQPMALCKLKIIVADSDTFHLILILI